MKCPYCGNEMIHGMIHIDSNGTFFEQRFVSDNDTPVKEKRQIMKRLLGVYAPAYTNMKECSDAWCCESCKKSFWRVPIKRRVGRVESAETERLGRGDEYDTAIFRLGKKCTGPCIS